MVHVGYVIEAVIVCSISFFLLVVILSRLDSYIREQSAVVAWKRLVLACGIAFTLVLEIVRSIDAWSAFRIYSPAVTHLLQSQVTCALVYCLALVISYNIDVLCSTIKHHTPKRCNQLLTATVIILHLVITACVVAELTTNDVDATPDGDDDPPPQEFYEFIFIRSTVIICIVPFVCASLVVVFFKLRTAVRQTVHHLRELEQRDLAAVGAAAKQDLTWAHRSTLLATDPFITAVSLPSTVNNNNHTVATEFSSRLTGGSLIQGAYLQPPPTSTSISKHVSSLNNTRRRIDLLESAVWRLCVVTCSAIAITAGAISTNSITLQLYVTHSLTVEEYLQPDSSQYQAQHAILSFAQLVALAVFVWYVWPDWPISNPITKVKPQSPLAPPASKVEDHTKAASVHEGEMKTVPPELFALHDCVPRTFHAADATSQKVEPKTHELDVVLISVRSDAASVELSASYHPSRTLPHPPYNSRVPTQDVRPTSFECEQDLMYVPQHLTATNVDQCAT